MNELTEKELAVCNAILEETGTETFAEYDDEDVLEGYERFVNVEDLVYRTKLSEQVVGGILTSLMEKAVVMMAEAKEYSLGCNCFYLIKDFK